MVWSLMICDLISKYSFQGGTADIFLWMGPIQCCRDIFLMNYYILTAQQTLLALMKK